MDTKEYGFDLDDCSKVGTPYDDIYRTLVVDCTRLIIPVINEVFQREIKEEAKIISLRNEVILGRIEGSYNKRIMDSYFQIENEIFHLECQSTTEMTILVRTCEYDDQIALENRKQIGNQLKRYYPNSAVLFLRCTKNTPDKMMVNSIYPESKDEHVRNIRIVKIAAYSLNDLFEKRLFFFIPFHIFAFEAHFDEYENNESKLEELIGIYEEIVERLRQCEEQGILTEYERTIIIDMIRIAVNSLARKYKKIRERIGRIMYGRVLEYPTKTAHRKAVAEGLAEGLALGLAEGRVEGLVSQIIKKLAKNKSVETIADELEESVERIQELICERNLV